MLRYFSYYSIGGYKDFYLGCLKDEIDVVYYVSKEQQENISCLHLMKIISATDSCYLPDAGRILFSHAGYKVICEHLEEDCYALAIRDIVNNDGGPKTGSTPFDFLFLCDKDDLKVLDGIAAYVVNNFMSFTNYIASLFFYDSDINGYGFRLRDLNDKIKKEVVDKNCSSQIELKDWQKFQVSSSFCQVSLLIMPIGLDEEKARIEQKLFDKEIKLLLSCEERDHEIVLKKVEKKMSKKQVKILVWIIVIVVIVVGVLIGVCATSPTAKVSKTVVSLKVGSINSQI